MEVGYIDNLFKQYNGLRGSLLAAGEITLLNDLNDSYRKAVLIASSCLFEQEIGSTILRYTKEISGENEILCNFIKNKAIERQYYTYFKWDVRNVNNFLGLFGEGFKNYMEGVIRNDGEMDISIKAFLEIGRERNRLVHSDYGVFTSDKSTEEVYELYRTALKFVNSIEEKFRAFMNRNHEG